MPSGIKLEVHGDCIKATLKMPSNAMEMRRRLDAVCAKALQAGAANIQVEIDMGSSFANRCYRFRIGEKEGVPCTIDKQEGTRRQQIDHSEQ